MWSSISRKDLEDNECLGLNVAGICGHEHRETSELEDVSRAWVGPRKGASSFPSGGPSSWAVPTWG